MSVIFTPKYQWNRSGTVLGNSNPLQSLSLISAILLKEYSWQPVSYMHTAMWGGGKNSNPL